MRTLLLIGLIHAAVVAVEIAPATVVRVVDGDTIHVRVGTDGDAKPLQVRLTWLDTPESKSNRHGAATPAGKEAAAYLARTLPIGTAVVLWSPGDKPATDVYGRTLAVVYPCDATLRADAAPPERPASIQELVIRAGWSPYWRKYGEAPEPLHGALLRAQADAEAAKAGAWASDPTYMRDKANERTAPKAAR